MSNLKKLGLAAVIVTAAGFAWVKTPHRNIPADLRDAVAESDGFDTAIPSVGKMHADIPLPVAAASEGFTEAVKKEYERILAAGHGFDGLPVAKLSELPPAARKQLAEDNQPAGAPNSSIPYKMAVQGKTVYVIQNENDEGMSVNIFSAAGARIAQGSYNEGFGWDEDSSAAGVNKLTKAPQASGSFNAAVKKEYERLTGYTDFNSGNYTLNTLPIAKVSELPAAAKKQYKKDVAEWGEYYLVTPYKMPVRGQTAYVIQVETEGGTFVTIFDAKGSKIAEGGCSESGDFGWSGDRMGSVSKMAGISRNGGMGHQYQDIGWRHAKLQAADGTKINVDYNIYYVTSNTILAAPVWINVSNPAFNGGENISAVLTTYYAKTTDTRNITLKSAGGGKFTAEAGHNPIAVSNTMGSGTTGRHEISVVVNGNWLTDPVSGTHHFTFPMGK